MAANQWLTTGAVLSDGSCIMKFVSGSEEWQIFNTDYENQILLVKLNLLQKWIDADLISDLLFIEIPQLGEDYRQLTGKHGYAISSVQQGPFPRSVLEAKAFVIALRETRKIIEDLSLRDAVYIEQISRLLPTYSYVEKIDDKTMLGTWLSGGVNISTDSYKRLSNLVGWMKPSMLAEIIAEAGFDIHGGDILTKQLPVKKGEIYSTTPGVQEGRDAISAEAFRLPGRPALEQFFNENILDIIMNEEKYMAMGISFPGAIVLHGPPGSGKTFAVEKLVTYLGWPCYSIDSSSIASPYIHDTSKKISELFDKAIENAPAVIVIDEMEAFLSDRGAMNTGTHHIEEVAEFLRRIPEAIKNRVLIVAMTNMIDQIDAAILRRGRFDHVIEVDLPSREEVEALLLSLLDPLPKTDDIDIVALALKLTGKPLSDVAYVVREAGRIAVKNNKTQIDLECLDVATSTLKDGAGENKRKIGFN